MIRNLVLATLMLVAVNVFAAEDDNTSGANTMIVPKQAAYGKSERKPSLGLFTGIVDTQNGRRNGTSYGAEYGYQPYIPFGAALEISGYVSDHSSDSPTLTRTRLLVKGNYNFGGTIPVLKDSYVGLGVGPVLDNQANRNDVELGIAPHIGFDIPLSAALSKYSLGATADYMIIGGPNPDVFALNGVVKYWF